VDFVVTLVKGFAGDIEKTFKLTTTLSSTNMHLFDVNDKLKKYATVGEIIDEYLVTRLDLYEKRRQSMIGQLEQDLQVASNKARFIGEILVETIDLRRKTQMEVDAVLAAKAYDMVDGDYAYLVDMKLGSLTNERVAKLEKDRDAYRAALELVRCTTAPAMWLADLDAFEAAYNVSATAARVTQSVPSGEPAEGAKKKVVRRKVAVKA
jgi:DNA topoisomerase-2